MVRGHALRARRVVEDVKSLTLIHVLEGIVAKIRLACMSVYSRRHLEFGVGRARAYLTASDGKLYGRICGHNNIVVAEVMLG